MNRLLIVILALLIAGTAAAEDTFGLWRVIDGDDYANFLPVSSAYEPFTLYISLHDPTFFSVGGYEVGMDTPPGILVLQASGPNGWTNFGDSTNHLVGFTTPVFANGVPFTTLGQIECLGVEGQLGESVIVYHGAEPPSIPDHDGPVIANGVAPDELIACGYVSGMPEVFRFAEPLATEPQTLSGVKSLFE